MRSNDFSLLLAWCNGHTGNIFLRAWQYKSNQEKSVSFNVITSNVDWLAPLSSGRIINFKTALYGMKVIKKSNAVVQANSDRITRISVLSKIQFKTNGFTVKTFLFWAFTATKISSGTGKVVKFIQRFSVRLTFFWT